ncbi:MAG: tetratricopeptide repeat protein [Phycisphaerales bacterium]|nr:MAG: tetratricopeptide repeat protein [Phycisphaerales bacterium]
MHLTRRGKRRLLALSLIAVICIGGAAAYKILGRLQQQRMLNETRAAGLTAQRRGDLDTALERFSEYFTYVKDDLEVNLAFADARAEVPLANGQHIYEAIDLFNRRCLKLLEQSPHLADRDRVHRDILDRLLGLYEAAGMRFELIQTADRILKTDPDRVDALKAKAGALYVDREFDLALPIARKLIELEPGNLSWCQLELEIRHRQNVADAELLAQCDRWIEQYEGTDGRFQLLKAAYLAPLGRVNEAREELVVAARKGAGSLVVLQQMVSLMDRLGQRDLASQVITAAREEFPREQWVAEATAQRLWQTGYVSEALIEIAAAEERFESLTAGLLRLKVLALAAGDRREEAVAALNELRSAGAGGESAAADRAWADALRARLSLTAQSQQSALETFGNALALQPNDAVIHYLIAEAYELVGEHSLALSSYELAHQVAPDWATASAAFANALLRQGLVQEAHDLAARLLNRTPPERRLPILLLYSRSYLALKQAGGTPALTDTRTGAPRDLVEILLAARAQLPDHAEIARLIAETYVLTGRTDRAKAFLLQVREDEAAPTGVLMALAEVSRRHGLDLELSLIRSAKQIDGLTLSIAFAQGDCLARDGEPEKGLRLIEEAMSSHPEEAVSATAQRQRVAFLIAIDHPDAPDSLKELIERFAAEPSIQTFALAQSAAWEDRQIIAAAITNLRNILGENAQQVRLAEARELVRFESDDDASLARAIVIINGVIEQSPHSLAALSLMAEASLRGEHPSPDRAIEHLERAIAQYPGQGLLYPRLISLLQQQGDYESAGQYLNRFSQLARRDAKLMRAEMNLLQAQGDFQAALVLASELVDDEATVSEQLALAMMYQQAGRYPEAEAIYAKLLEQDAQRELVVAQAAEFYARTGRFEQGAQIIESLSAETGSATRSTLLGTFNLRHGSMEEAGRWLNRAVVEDPQSPAAHNQLARYYLATDDPIRAQEQATAGLRLSPDDRALRSTLAAAGFRLGETERTKALAVLRELGAENDDLLATLELLERIPIVEGKAKAAAEHLDAARSLAEQRLGFLPAWHLAVTLHAEVGRTQDALELARRALRNFPTRTEPAQWTTQLLAGAERWEEALIEAEEWRRRTVDDAIEADVAIASILLELHRPADAVAQIEPYADRLYAQRLKSPREQATWIRALVESGRTEQATSVIEPLLREDHGWRELWRTLARKMNVGDAQAALGLLEAASAEDPQELLLLAAEYNHHGRRGGGAACFDRAEQLARKAGETEPLQATSLILRGIIAEARGEPEAAVSLYRAALELDPDNSQALNNLAFVLTATTTDRHEEALELVRRALEASPDNPDFLDTRAQVLRHLDRPAEAIESLQRALASRPEDVSIGLNLVDVLLEQRQYAAAEEVLDETRRHLEESPAVGEAERARAEALSRRLRQARAAVDS